MFPNHAFKVTFRSFFPPMIMFLLERTLVLSRRTATYLFSCVTGLCFLEQDRLVQWVLAFNSGRHQTLLVFSLWYCHKVYFPLYQLCTRFLKPQVIIIL